MLYGSASDPKGKHSVAAIQIAFRVILTPGFSIRRPFVLAYLLKTDQLWLHTNLFLIYARVHCTWGEHRASRQTNVLCRSIGGAENHRQTLCVRICKLFSLFSLVVLRLVSITDTFGHSITGEIRLREPCSAGFCNYPETIQRAS